MNDIIENILAENFLKAKEIFNIEMDKLVEDKLNQLYQSMSNEMFESHNVQKLGRIRLVRARVRQGKIQRRKKLSNVPGYTIRQGHMVRMSSQERQHRKLAARRSKPQRKAHLRQALIKRRISLRKRRANV
jgi:hypothetical protein